MRTLTLFRHAKSSWSDLTLGDFSRRLAPRGIKAAPRMGRFLAENDLIPDLVCCSTAARAQETLDLALAEWASPPTVRHMEGLYHAPAETLLDVVRETDDGIESLMLVGHNPGMHMLAHMLTAHGSRKALDRLAIKFPTAAIAVFGLSGHWRDTRFGTGELKLFQTPKMLDD